MANVGRPRALDEIKRREVCALISAGCGIERAAQYVGCNPSTIRREALRNEEFYDSLRRSELASELEPLRLLHNKAKTHWRAAAWLLERFNPERFTKRNPDTVTRDQFYEVLEKFVDAVSENIPNPKLRKRIILRLGTALRQQARETFALRRPIRNPHSRKRRSS